LQAQELCFLCILLIYSFAVNDFLTAGSMTNLLKIHITLSATFSAIFSYFIPALNRKGNDYTIQQFFFLYVRSQGDDQKDAETSNSWLTPPRFQSF
jgi:hypothetical protein